MWRHHNKEHKQQKKALSTSAFFLLLVTHSPVPFSPRPMFFLVFLLLFMFLQKPRFLSLPAQSPLCLSLYWRDQLIAAGTGFWRLEVSKCQFYLQDRKEERKIQGNNRPASPTSIHRKVMGENSPGSHFQTHEGEGSWEYSACIYQGEIRLNQNDSPLQWGD